MTDASEHLSYAELKAQATEGLHCQYGRGRGQSRAAYESACREPLTLEEIERGYPRYCSKHLAEYDKRSAQWDAEHPEHAERVRERQEAVRAAIDEVARLADESRVLSAAADAKRVERDAAIVAAVPIAGSQGAVARAAGVSRALVTRLVEREAGR